MAGGIARVTTSHQQSFEDTVTTHSAQIIGVKEWLRSIEYRWFLAAEDVDKHSLRDQIRHSLDYPWKIWLP